MMHRCNKTRQGVDCRATLLLQKIDRQFTVFHALHLITSVRLLLTLPPLGML